MQPLRDNIIVKRVAHERKTDSGLILQSNAGEPDRAEVISLGPKVDEVQIGDVVLLNWNKAKNVSGDLWVISEDDIVAVFEDD